MPPYEPSRSPRRTSLNASLARAGGPSLPLLALGAGALLGLILGLILGWGVFPVRWTNAWPGDLSDEARAQYLAAVAEAYVYYGNAQAAEIARNRLYDLNDNLADEIAAAQRFFADHPQVNNANIYISNLGRLAQGLNAVSPETIVDTAPAESAPAAGAPTTGGSAVGTRVRSWVNWLLLAVAALALVVGGLMVITRLSKRRAATTDSLDDEPEGFEDEDDFATQPGRSPFQRPLPSPLPTSVRDTSRTRERDRPQTAAPHGEDYGFDEEHDESPAAFASGTALDDLAAEDDFYDEPALDLDDEEIDRGVELDEEADEDLYEALDEGDFEPMEAEARATFAQPALRAPFDQTFDQEAELDQEHYAHTAPRSGQGTLVKTFTVHYQTGIPDYDQSYSIMDPEGGRYIGECGMGVNLKNGILQNNPDNVIALDVWLVDKKQEKSYSSQSRVLLSEYVIDNNLESAFTRERPNDAAPLVPQPGMTFQLKGPSLLLECEVLEAKYIAGGPTAGIFQSVKLDMTVLAID